MKRLAVVQSKWGLLYLAVGVVAALMFSAVGAANTQSPLFGVSLAALAFVFYVALYELAAINKATARSSVVVATALGIVACFWVMSAVSDAVINGHFTLMPGRLSWVIPLGVVIWTARELYNRKRPSAPI